MKTFGLCLTILAIVGPCWTGTAFAQESRQTTILPPRLEHSIRIVHEYDRFTGRGSLTLGPAKVKDFPGGHLSFMATCSYVGQRPAVRPITYVFGLIAATLTRVRAGNTTLYVIADGERYTLGPLVFAAENEVGDLAYGSGYGVFLSLRELTRIARAGHVEMRFDGIEFELTQEHRNALRDFIAYAGDETPHPLTPQPAVPPSPPLTMPPPPRMP